MIHSWNQAYLDPALAGQGSLKSGSHKGSFEDLHLYPGQMRGKVSDRRPPFPSAETALRYGQEEDSVIEKLQELGITVPQNGYKPDFKYGEPYADEPAENAEISEGGDRLKIPRVAEVDRSRLVVRSHSDINPLQQVSYPLKRRKGVRRGLNRLRSWPTDEEVQPTY